MFNLNVCEVLIKNGNKLDLMESWEFWAYFNNLQSKKNALVDPSGEVKDAPGVQILSFSCSFGKKFAEW